MSVSFRTASPAVFLLLYFTPLDSSGRDPSAFLLHEPWESRGPIHLAQKAIVDGQGNAFILISFKIFRFLLHIILWLAFVSVTRIHST